LNWLAMFKLSYRGWPSNRATQGHYSVVGSGGDDGTKQGSKYA
jgi:hypothetical protein